MIEAMAYIGFAMGLAPMLVLCVAVFGFMLV